MPGLVWPPVPVAGGAAVLAILQQLEGTQWLPPDELHELQAKQLSELLRHAYESVPFYRERWNELPVPADLGNLPVVGRRDLQERFEQLKSRAIPFEHGELGESRTSGSTGAPVRVLKSELQGVFWRALTLREHGWHGRDFSRTLAVIRRGAGRGSSPSWGAATQGLVETGPCLKLDVNVDTGTQLDWLQRHEPAYLLTFPSLASDLAKLALERGTRLSGLSQVRTLGESVDPDLRSLCRRAWDASLVDMYSTEEVGYIALQCPEHAHYHVQSENVLVEVLDERGKACAPGQTGRVVVTDLHNFAMPLVRYEIGDYAEVGEPCRCGRGLAVLRRILGRVRNMLVAPDGRRYWPAFGLRALMDIVPLRQYQVVQKAIDAVEIRLVPVRPLSSQEEHRLTERISEHLPAGMQLRLAYCEHVPRSASGKFEEFVSEIPPPSGS
jgi:phenylacetate-CoA ligase